VITKDTSWHVLNEYTLSIRRCQHREMVLNTSYICYYRMSSMTEKLPFGLGEMPLWSTPTQRNPLGLSKPEPSTLAVDEFILTLGSSLNKTIILTHGECPFKAENVRSS